MKFSDIGVGILSLLLVSTLMVGVVGLEALLAYGIYNYLIVPAFALKTIPFIGFFGIILGLNLITGIIKGVSVK